MGVRAYVHTRLTSSLIAVLRGTVLQTRNDTLPPRNRPSRRARSGRSLFAAAFSCLSLVAAAYAAAIESLDLNSFLVRLSGGFALDAGLVTATSPGTLGGAAGQAHTVLDIRVVPSDTHPQKFSTADPRVGGRPYGHHPVAIAFSGGHFARLLRRRSRGSRCTR